MIWVRVTLLLVIAVAAEDTSATAARNEAVELVRTTIAPRVFGSQAALSVTCRRGPQRAAGTRRGPSSRQRSLRSCAWPADRKLACRTHSM